MRLYCEFRGTRYLEARARKVRQAGSWISASVDAREKRTGGVVRWGGRKCESFLGKDSTSRSKNVNAQSRYSRPARFV